MLPTGSRIRLTVLKAIRTLMVLRLVSESTTYRAGRNSRSSNAVGMVGPSNRACLYLDGFPAMTVGAVGRPLESLDLYVHGTKPGNAL